MKFINKLAVSLTWLFSV